MALIWCSVVDMVFSAALLILIINQEALPAVFIKAEQKDYPLREMGTLTIENARGDIIVEASSSDRIRVFWEKIVNAESEGEAENWFKSTEITNEKNFEKGAYLVVEYGRNQAFADKFRERREPRVRMNLRVQAPSGLGLRLYAGSGQATVKGWKGDVFIRSGDGGVTVSHINASQVSVVCTGCPVELDSIEASVRVLSGSGAQNHKRLKGREHYFESLQGSIDVVDVHGDQYYVSSSGAISTRSLEGQIQFSIGSGTFKLRDGAGALGGESDSGHVDAEIRSWVSSDRGLIVTRTGSVRIVLPRRFEGELDMESNQGRVEAAFDIRHELGKEGSDSPENNRVKGRVGAQGAPAWIRIFSEAGTIRVLKGI